MLNITANVVREAFNETPHGFIIIEDVTALERTLGQLVRVHIAVKRCYRRRHTALSDSFITLDVAYVLRK